MSLAGRAEAHLKRRRFSPANQRKRVRESSGGARNSRRFNDSSDLKFLPPADTDQNQRSKHRNRSTSSELFREVNVSQMASNYNNHRRHSQSPAEEYQNLRLTNVNPILSDPHIKNFLEKEFCRFSGMAVRILHFPDHRDPAERRVVYVNFDRPGQARVARRGSQRSLQDYLGRELRIDRAGFKDVSGRNFIRERQTNVSPRNDQVRGRRNFANNARQADGFFSNNRRSPFASRERSISPPYRRFDRDDYVDRVGRFSPRASSPVRADRNRMTDYNATHRRPISRNDLPLQDGSFSSGFNNRTPNRTLFMGNLPSNITSDDLDHLCRKYGRIEDIDIKRIHDGCPIAFIRFQNMDMAEAAAEALTDFELSSCRLKIGYGRPYATRRLWVGGLGAGVSLQALETEFDRFGAIEKIDFIKGENHAYILFDNTDAAVEAQAKMNQFVLKEVSTLSACGTTATEEYQLRVDFASDDLSSQNSSGRNSRRSPRSRSVSRDRSPHRRRGRRSLSRHSAAANEHHLNGTARRGSDRSSRRTSANRDAKNKDGRRSEEETTASKQPERRISVACVTQALDSNRQRTTVLESAAKISNANGGIPPAAEVEVGRQHARVSSDGSSNHIVPEDPVIAAAVTPVSSADDGCSVISTTAVSCDEFLASFKPDWYGNFVLKKSVYPVQLIRLKGKPEIVRSLFGLEQAVTSGSNASGGAGSGLQFVIGQRLSLTQPKQDDAIRWSNNPDFTFLFATANGSSLATSGPEGLQNRPLKLLIKYFKEKTAAGVINLAGNGVVYAFPYCAFVETLLNELSSNCSQIFASAPDDCLLVIAMKGGPI